MFRTGLIGTVIAVLCCVTPLAVWLVTALRPAAAMPYLDPVIFAVLATSLLLMLLGWHRNLRG